MLRVVRIPDDVEGAPRLHELWTAAAERHLAILEVVLGWLADRSHPIQRLVAAWLEMYNAEEPVPYQRLLMWMCEDRIYDGMAHGSTGVDEIIREWRRGEYGVYS